MTDVTDVMDPTNLRVHVVVGVGVRVGVRARRLMPSTCLRQHARNCVDDDPVHRLIN